MNKNDVIEGVEQTSPDVSQTSEAESTSEAVSNEDISSNEDVKMQSEEGSDEVVEGAKEEVKSEKGVNRVQQLANEKNDAVAEAKALREQLEQRKSERKTQLEQKLQNAEPDVRSNAEMLLMKQEISDMKINGLYQQAEAEHPELKKNSDSYDQKFDDMVYESFLVRSQQDPAITPTDIANEYKTYFQTQRDQGAKRAENERQIKKTVSTGRQVASSDDSTSNEYDDNLNTFKKSGKVDDLAALM